MNGPCEDGNDTSVLVKQGDFFFDNSVSNISAVRSALAGWLVSY